MAEAAAAFGPDWLLFDPARQADPYRFLHRLREVAPVCWSPQFNEWILTRWADCQAVLREPRFSSNAVHSSMPLEGPMSLLRDATSAILLFIDPPDHTRLRGLVSQAFTPRRVEALRPRIAAIVDGLLTATEQAGGGTARRADLMTALAQPLPVLVICELLGVPAADRDRFGPWSSAASRLLDGELDEPTMTAGIGAAGELFAYFLDLFEQRRNEPRDDLLSALVAAEAQGDRLEAQELLAITVLLFVAGHETTTNLIGNGTLALLRHPDQAALLRDRPDIARNAVEELLRFDPPVQITGRFATDDLEVGGVTVQKGEGVAVMLAGANRDPAQYPDPDRLDLTRADTHHLAFSQGIHYCLGAALARLEGEVALPVLLRRFPRLELVTTDPPYREHRVLRGLAELPVAW
jgi:hypothetical protein